MYFTPGTIQQTIPSKRANERWKKRRGQMTIKWRKQVSSSKTILTLEATSTTDYECELNVQNPITELDGIAVHKILDLLASIEHKRTIVIWKIFVVKTLSYSSKSTKIKHTTYFQRTYYVIE